MSSNIKSYPQHGFTLVELAIVLMIIGLLIGGILRGQELMENARITTTIQQTKSYDAATTTFRDSYAALPGDMINPDTRLPNCTTGSSCDVDGDANGLVGTAITSLTGTVGLTGENQTFWLQLAAANLISGVNSTATGTQSWGNHFPTAKISGGFMITQASMAAATPMQSASGLYLVLKQSPTSGAINEATGTAAISPLRAGQFDRKLDDGFPVSGDVRGVGTTACTAATYTESSTTKDCNLLIRVQN
jgi:prepilin-type N-terminal cleavage/methylation domain-containing protein